MPSHHLTPFLHPLQARAQERNRQLEVDRKHHEEKASELARVIAEREEALKAERERRKTEALQGATILSSQDAPPRRLLQRSSSSDAMQVDAPSIRTPDIATSAHVQRHLSKLNISGNRLTVEPPLMQTSSAIAEFHLIPTGTDDHAGRAEKFFALPTIPAGLNSTGPYVLFRIPITSKYFSTSRGRRKLAGLERELEALAQVSHPSVRPIEGFQLQRVEPSDTSAQDGFALSILHPPANAQQVTLDTLLAFQPLPVAKCLAIAQQLLAGLADLHARNLLLKDLTLDRIALHADAAQLDTIWCGSVGESDRANSFTEGHEAVDTWPTGWAVPELRDELRFSRKSDAYVLGRVIVLCLVGKSALKAFDGPHAAFDAWCKSYGSTATPLSKFLTKLLDPQPRKRINPIEAAGYLDSLVEAEAADAAKQLLPTPSFQHATGPLSPAPTVGIFTSPGVTPLSAALPEPPRPAAASRAFFSSNQAPPPAATTSRFLSDFVPLSILGKGAFGVVSKVKNRLDGGVYAVKKIRLDGHGEEGGEEKTLREIGALARVNHPHITRYYAAWIEEANVATATDEDELTSSVATSSTDDKGKPRTASSQATSSSDTPSEASSAATMSISQARSFSVSFGPPKDSDFDDLDRDREEDFFSQVGFRADDEDDEGSGDSSNSEDDNSSTSDESDTDSDGRGASNGRTSRKPQRADTVLSRRAIANASRSRNGKRLDAFSISRSASRRGSVQKPRWLYIQVSRERGSWW